MATLQQIIAALPIGKANAMKVPVFEQAIGNQARGTNDDQTRREVKSAIYDNEIPIGSSPPVGKAKSVGMTEEGFKKSESLFKKNFMGN